MSGWHSCSKERAPSIILLGRGLRATGTRGQVPWRALEAAAKRQPRHAPARWQPARRCHTVLAEELLGRLGARARLCLRLSRELREHESKRPTSDTWFRRRKNITLTLFFVPVPVWVLYTRTYCTNLSGVPILAGPMLHVEVLQAFAISRTQCPQKRVEGHPDAPPARPPWLQRAVARMLMRWRTLRDGAPCKLNHLL